MVILLLAAAKDIHCVRWANSLSNKNDIVHVAFLSNHEQSQDKFNKNVILHKLKYSSPFGYYINKIQLKKIIKEIKPDIVNAHFASGYGTLGRLIEFKPFLLSVYGSDIYEFPYKKKLNKLIIRKNLNSATAIASTSNAMAKQITRLIDIDKKDIYITPFGVDITKFVPSSSENKENKENKTIIIGSIKKLEKKYGIKYGILAVDYLLKNILPNNINIKYLIYGKGSEELELRNIVKKCGIENSVRFMGRIPNEEVPVALRKMDIFLGTSINDSESFGVAIVEAMACGIPVIVTDVDGFKEVVENGKIAPMLIRKDYKNMAAKIYEIITCSDYSNKLAIDERNKVLKYYNWEDNVKQMKKIYKILIQSSRGTLIND